MYLPCFFVLPVVKEHRKKQDTTSVVPCPLARSLVAREANIRDFRELAKCEVLVPSPLPPIVYAQKRRKRMHIRG